MKSLLPVFGALDHADNAARVRALARLQALELGTGGWPGHDHLAPMPHG